jgi:putative membrane protein
MEDLSPLTIASPDSRMEYLTRFLFSAPPWYSSLVAALVPGILLDLLTSHLLPYPWAGTLLLSVPAAAATFLTVPLVRLCGGTTTLNRSALLALCCTIFQLAAVVVGLIMPVDAIFLFLAAFSLGLIAGIRLIVLVATADHRPSRMLVPALVQTLAGLFTVVVYPTPGFISVTIVATVVTVAASLLLIFLITFPLERMLHFHIFGFLNAFLAHLDDGSPGMDDWFRRMGEQVSVPQATLVIRRAGKPDIVMTVPNLHPGPVGDAGGGTLPHVLHGSFPGEVLVPHGCATHDFNPVAADEIQRVVATVRRSLQGLVLRPGAGPSSRIAQGSVSLLAQRFDDTLLVVGTRAPESTEDLDPSMALILMAEARGRFRHLVFIEAHNSMTEVSGGIDYGTTIATEYVDGLRSVVSSQSVVSVAPFRAGVSQVQVPYGRTQGFGELGIQALVIETGGQETAYVLLDGNNIIKGAREIFRNAALELVDDAEIMTTDTHVVNTITGNNPVGLEVPPPEIVPYIRKAVEDARADLAPAEAGGATACCRGITVFGSHRIAQIAAAITSILTFLAPLGIALIFFTLLLSFLTWVMWT